MLRRYGCRKIHSLYIADILISTAKERDRVPKYIRMVINIKESGIMTNRMEKDSFGIRMGITTTDSGSTPKLMDKAYIHQQMDQFTTGSGKTIFNMGKAKRLGLINRTLRANIIKEQNMVKENINTLMALCMMAIGATIKSLVLALTLGQILRVTRDNGLIIICTDTGFSIGLMAGDIKETTLMIRSMASAYTLGQMEGNTQASGKTDSSMAKEFIKMFPQWREQGSGKKAKELRGLMTMTLVSKWKKLIVRRKMLKRLKILELIGKKWSSK